jgi:hypothetical protein
MAEKKYRVTLTAAENELLNGIIHRGKEKMRRVL